MQSQSARRDFSRLLKPLVGILHDIAAEFSNLYQSMPSMLHTPAIPSVAAWPWFRIAPARDVIELHLYHIVKIHGSWLRTLVIFCLVYALSYPYAPCENM